MVRRTIDFDCTELGEIAPQKSKETEKNFVGIVATKREAIAEKKKKSRLLDEGERMSWTRILLMFHGCGVRYHTCYE